MDSSCDHHLHHPEVSNNTIEETEPTPQLCANGCGFYGTKANKNLCSSCFKKSILQKEEVVDSPSINPLTCFNNNIIDNKDESLRNEDDAACEKKNEKVMCRCCNKKIKGLMIFTCRCGERFCTKHRYPEEHSCNFDFKNLGHLTLATQNPVVEADKLAHRI